MNLFFILYRKISTAYFFYINSDPDRHNLLSANYSIIQLFSFLIIFDELYNIYSIYNHFPIVEILHTLFPKCIIQPFSDIFSIQFCDIVFHHTLNFVTLVDKKFTP